MDITGEYKIAAPPERVWEALNDPEILRQAIPGCEEITALSATEIEAVIVSKIGPVKATFKSLLTITNLNPPSSYTLSGKGKGGVAGFGRGSADVTLSPDGNETILSYTADFSVGGKLAQVGSRLIVAATRKIADDFFAKFSQLLNAT